MFAALTPLRDVAGLADNLPLLIIAAILVFRASFELPGWGAPPPGAGSRGGRRARSRAGRRSSGDARSLYALYRIVARLAGSTDLPLGNCLVAEAVIIPLLMVVSDGFLLAWVLTELRNAGLDDAGEDRLDTRQAIALMPGGGAGVRARFAGSLPGDASSGWARPICRHRPVPRPWEITCAGSSAGD